MEFFYLFLLIILNGFFSLMEVAFITSEKENIEKEAEAGNKCAVTIIGYMKEPEKFLSSIQVGITLIGIVSGVFSGISLTDNLTTILSSFPIFEFYAKEVALIIVVGGVTYLSIVIGELVPKTIGMRNPEKILIRLFPIVNIFNLLFLPFVVLLSYTTKLIMRLIKMDIKSEENKDLLKEIIGFTAIAARKNRISKTQQDIINNAVMINDKKVFEIMVEMKDVKSLYSAQSIAEAMIESHIHHHTRYPLFDEDKKEIIGYVNFKDIMNALKISSGKPTLKAIARPIYSVLKDEMVSELLPKLIKNHQHISLVKDGEKVVGIITLENLLETVVGKIEDEYDVAPNIFYAISDDRWLVGGGVVMKQICGFFSEFDCSDVTFGEWIKDKINGELVAEKEIKFRDYKIIIRKVSRGRLYEAIIDKSR